MVNIVVVGCMTEESKRDFIILGGGEFSSPHVTPGEILH
jgi:hypothetical protein